MKYIGTITFLPTKFEEIYKKLTGIEQCRQFRIVVKCKGKKDAERICEEVGLSVKFDQKFSSETFNEVEMAACDKDSHGIAVANNNGRRHLDDYITIDELVSGKKIKPSRFFKVQEDK